MPDVPSISCRSLPRAPQQSRKSADRKHCKHERRRWNRANSPLERHARKSCSPPIEEPATYLKLSQFLRRCEHPGSRRLPRPAAFCRRAQATNGRAGERRPSDRVSVRHWGGDDARKKGGQRTSLHAREPKEIAPLHLFHSSPRAAGTWLRPIRNYSITPALAGCAKRHSFWLFRT